MGSDKDGSDGKQNTLPQAIIDQQKDMPIIVDNGFAIIGNSKINRAGTDGTTIVFYDAPNEKQINNEIYVQEETGYFRNLTPDEKKQIDNGGVDNRPYITEQFPIKLHPANDETKKDFKEAFRQVEGIADIKYYDINNLTDEDRKYFEANNIKIPPTADFSIVSGSSYILNDDTDNINSHPAYGYNPRDNDDAPSSKALISDGLEKYDDKAYVRFTALHENLHLLGFKHSFDTSNGNASLDCMKDNTGNTVMSYTQVDEYGLTFYPQKYQKIDIEALQKLYGVSKHITPKLMEDLDKDAAERKNFAGTSTFKDYLHEQDFIKDMETHKNNDTKLYNKQTYNTLIDFFANDDDKVSVVNANKLKQLIKISSEAKKAFINGSDQNIINEKDPDLSHVSFTKIVEGDQKGQYVMNYNMGDDAADLPDGVTESLGGEAVILTPDAVKELQQITHKKGETDRFDLNLMKTDNNKALPKNNHNNHAHKPGHKPAGPKK